MSNMTNYSMKVNYIKANYYERECDHICWYIYIFSLSHIDKWDIKNVTFRSECSAYYAVCDISDYHGGLVNPILGENLGLCPARSSWPYQVTPWWKSLIDWQFHHTGHWVECFQLASAFHCSYLSLMSLT